MTSRRIHLTDDQVSLALERMRLLHLEKDRKHNQLMRPPQRRVIKNLNELTATGDAILQCSKKACKALVELQSLQNDATKTAPSTLIDPPEELTCPVCLGVFENKIFLCKNGHSVCESCAQKLKSCPQCRVSFKGDKDKIRNLALEKLAENFRRERDNALKQVPQTRPENFDELLKSKQESMLRVVKRLETANKSVTEAHINWKDDHFNESKRIEVVRGLTAVIEAKTKQLTWNSEVQQTKFWEAVLRASKKS